MKDYSDVNRRHHAVVGEIWVHEDGSATIALKNGGGMSVKSPEEAETELSRIDGKREMNALEKAKADMDYRRHFGGFGYRQAKRHYEKLLRKERMKHE